MATFEKVAVISKLFGRNGELAISIYDTFPEDFDLEEPLFADMDSLTVPLYFDSFERRGKKGATVKIADFDTDKRAEELIGKELFVSRQVQKHDTDEIYFSDLIGFTATFDGSTLKGEISDFIDSDYNPLLSVTVEGREVLVPAENDMISDLDIESRTIEFNLPEGLLELYL